MNWYVGQKVVCIKTHSQGLVVKGKNYSVHGVNCCPLCGFVSLDVGVIGNGRSWSCMKKHRVHSGTWVATTLFRPVDALTEQIERIEKEGAPVEPELIRQILEAWP